MRWPPICLLLCLVGLQDLFSKKIKNENNKLRKINRREVKLDEMNKRIYFLQEPKEEYYLVKNRPVTIQCSARNVKLLNIRCVGQWMNPTIENDFIHQKRKLQHGFDSTPEAEIDSSEPFQRNTKTNEILKVSVVITKGDLKDFVDPAGYWCECYAWKHKQSTLHSNDFIISTRAIIHSAYMRRYFEREPLSSSVELRGTVQLECLPPPGMPQPEVWWMKGGRVIDATNDSSFIITNEGNLIIVQARLSDAANYTCVAQNVAYKLRSDPARVVVYEKEKWSDWSECSGFCMQKRIKKCKQHVPVQAGMYCLQDWIEMRTCGANVELKEEVRTVVGEKAAVPLCPLKQWSEWSSWSSCSIDCIQHKKRYCNNGNKRRVEGEVKVLDKHINQVAQTSHRFNKKLIQNDAYLDGGDNVLKDNAFYDTEKNNFQKKRYQSNISFINNINNHTDYCAEYELEMRNCSQDSCFVSSNLEYEQQSEVTIAMIMIIIISTILLILFSIITITYRLLSNKANFWDKGNFQESKCMDSDMDNPNQKHGSTTPLTPPSNNHNVIRTYDECVHKNNHGNGLPFSDNTKGLNMNWLTNNKLINKMDINHDSKDAKQKVGKSSDGSLFGSYKQKIKVRMVKRLMRQKELYDEHDELKQLKVNALANDFENCRNELLQENIHFNNDSVNFNNNINNTNSSNSTINTSKYNENAQKINRNMFSTPQSTSTSTTTSNMTPLNQRRLTTNEITENTCNDITLWHNISQNGGAIHLGNYGVSLTMPTEALDSDHVIFLGVSRLNRPHLKKTQTLLSSVVVCGFHENEVVLNKPAMIKLRHNAVCINSDQWLFTLLKFNQSDSLEINQLKSASFSLDDEYCYILDYVLSGYALIGEPSSGNESSDIMEGSITDDDVNTYKLNNENNLNMETNISKSGIYHNTTYSHKNGGVENTCDLLNNTLTSTQARATIEKTRINFTNGEVSEQGQDYNNRYNNINLLNDYDVIENNNNKEINDSIENAKIRVSPPKPIEKQTIEHPSAINNDINVKTAHKNVSRLGSSSNAVSKMLKIASFFPTTINSEEITLKIYFVDDNPDSLEYAVEMERKEGYSMLGISTKFQFHFELEGNVLVSLSDLNGHWYTLSQQQEIPFVHLWNNRQMGIHCSFSLQHKPHSRHQLPIQHLIKQTSEQQTQQQIKDFRIFNNNNTQQIDIKNESNTQKLPSQNVQPYQPFRPFSYQQNDDTNTICYDFSCTILIKQKLIAKSFKKISLDKACLEDKTNGLNYLQSLHQNNGLLLKNEGKTNKISSMEDNEYDESIFSHTQNEFKQNTSVENIYNSVYDKSSTSSSEQNLCKENVSSCINSSLKRLLSQKLDLQGWQDLATLMGLHKHVGYFESKPFPSELVLNLWEAKNKRNNDFEYLNELIGYFTVMQRKDLIDVIECNYT